MAKSPVVPRKKPFLQRFAAPKAEVKPTAKPGVFIPKKTSFRIHPDVLRVSPDVFIMQCNKQWYLLDPALIADGTVNRHFWRATLYQGILLNGDSVILPVTYPAGSGYEGWHDSMTDMIEHARHHWMQVRSDHDEKRYIGTRFRSEKAQPTWPIWTLDELIEQAFGDRILDADHPIIAALQQSAVNSMQEVIEEV
jgi:hypothetical protein